MTLHKDQAKPRRLSGFKDDLTQRQFDEFHDFAERSLRGPGSGAIRQSVGGEQKWSEEPTGVNRHTYYDPDTGLWTPGTPRNPLIDLKYNPSGAWPMHRASGLADLTTNGFDLTVETGAEHYSYITPSTGCFRFDGASVLTVTGAQDLLGPTGDYTFLCMVTLVHNPAAQTFIAGYEDASADADPANNTRWSLFFETDHSITHISESGAGVNFNYNISSYVFSYQPSFIGVTREANQIQHYVNGHRWGAKSSAGTTPDGGSNARFRLGGREGGAAFMTGCMANAAIYPRALSRAEMAERYSYLMGKLYGFKTDEE